MSNYLNLGVDFGAKTEIIAAVDGVDDGPGKHVSKSLIIGGNGPYIPFPSHSFFAYLGPKTSILLLDCRYVEQNFHELN
jgi:hypothetical protein